MIPTARGLERPGAFNCDASDPGVAAAGTEPDTRAQRSPDGSAFGVAGFMKSLV